MSSSLTLPLPPVARYYRRQAWIYDSTRWAFLFGRNCLVRRIATYGQPQRLLEIGCGTGRNLAALARAFPQAEITGLDLSSDMLDRARPKLKPFGARVSLLHQAYESPIAHGTPFDLIVLSYSLSMINPGHDQVLRLCQSDLAPGGNIAVADFHDSAHPWFRRWMGMNHVRMEKQIFSALQDGFTPLTCEIESAYFGLWRYLIFVGKNQPAEAWKL